ncbi:MAG: hypothetical protein NT031_11835 [Planctomycetota bacterium]|nr:hypothetical protein [Planctomycetota bacterium]
MKRTAWIAALAAGVAATVFLGMGLWRGQRNPDREPVSVVRATAKPSGRIGPGSDFPASMVARGGDTRSGPADVRSVDANIDPLLCDMPKAIEDEQVDMIETLATVDRIWKQQHETIKAWPRYEEIRARLQKDVEGIIDCDHSSERQFVQAARVQQKLFWQAGGTLSKDSYRNIFLARAMLEEARSRFPKSLAITDELVQTIQSADMLVKPDDENRKVRNKELEETVLSLRAGQFSQIEQEVRQGRTPTPQDFICAHDLAVLKGLTNPASSVDVLDWIDQHASRGGWDGYAPMFAIYREYIRKGQSFSCNIYHPTKPDFPYDFRYVSRLPSFRWPKRNGDERELALWGASPGGMAVLLKEIRFPDHP